MGCIKNKITRLIWCGDQEVSKQLGACRTSNPPVGVALVRRQCPCAVGHASSVAGAGLGAVVVNACLN